MRPLAKPPLSDDVRAEDIPAFLLTQLGPFCAFSERPLRDVFRIWTALAWPPMPEPVALRPLWEELLPIDPTTLQAALSRWPILLGRPGILAPDRDDTFFLTGPSPFTYDMEEVTTWYLNDDGSPEGDPQVEMHVIVRGHGAAARATIDLFALNSIYYDPRTGELRIPRRSYLRMDDSRLQERTAAWNRATQAAALAAEVNEATRPLILDQIRMMAAMTGFWSVWATVFWKRFEDAETVRRVTVEPMRTFVAVTAEVIAPRPFALSGPGPHNAFPGTRAAGLR